MEDTKSSDPTADLTPWAKLILSLPPIPPEELARRERAAVRLRERLLSIPYYAERDRREGMAFFRNLHASRIMTD